MAWNDNIDKETPAFDFACNEQSIIRVMAGPGTGKSFGLKRRVARLIENGVDPKRILAVTFTRTAAADLKREILSLNILGANNVAAQTLHSLCFKILNKRDILTITGRYPRPMLQHEIKAMLYDLNNDIFGGIKDKKRRIQAFEAAWARLQHEDPSCAIDEVDKLFENELKDWLIYHESMLIGEMVIETLNYLRNNPECPERNWYQHVLVDEYQDLNKAEQVLISLLKGQGSLAVIGDDDQSIYSFRYAHPEGIRNFNKEFNESISIDFEECRRCPKDVVNIASNLISNNKNRTLGALRPRSENEDGNIKIIQWKTLDEEIEGLVKIIIRNLGQDNLREEDILVLTSSRLIGYKIRDLLNKNGINSKSYFREEALDSDEAKKAFSLLNLAARPDDQVALRYLLGHDNKSYRNNAYLRLLEKAKELDISIKEVLERIKIEKIRIPYTKEILGKYNEIIEEMIDFINTIKEDNKRIVDYLAPIANTNLMGFREVLESILELLGDCDSEDNFNDWLKKFYKETLEKISLPDSPDNINHIRIMSLHASKGLSAKFVIITSCVEGLIPRIAITENDELSKEEAIEILEEQRRLFYVAITRCKNEPGIYNGTLIISSFVCMPGVEALRMNIPAKPDVLRNMYSSRFLRELGSTNSIPIKGMDYLEEILNENEIE